MDESERGVDQRVRTSMRELVELSHEGAADDITAERVHRVDSDHAHVTPAKQAGRYDRERDATENRPAGVTDRDVEGYTSTETHSAQVSDGESASGDAGTEIEDAMEPTDGTATELEEW